MKKLLLLAAALIALPGCGPLEAVDTVGVSANTVTPGSVHDYRMAFASALDCAPNGLEWSVLPALGDHSAATCVDGCVTQDGVFTAPRCGSVYIGSIVTVQALCVSNGRIGQAQIAVAEEILESLDIAAAQVSECGASPCMALVPTDIHVRLCGVSEPPTTITFYARINFTCGPWMSPEPPTNLPACPLSVSPGP